MTIFLDFEPQISNFLLPPSSAHSKTNFLPYKCVFCNELNALLASSTLTNSTKANPLKKKEIIENILKNNKMPTYVVYSSFLATSPFLCHHKF